MAKETYLHGKRGLLSVHSMPNLGYAWMREGVKKATYSYGKGDLFIWQKRPIHMAKETYSYIYIKKEAY